MGQPFGSTSFAAPVAAGLFCWGPLDKSLFVSAEKHLSMARTDWKRFERLVAAIHHAESKGAEVRWDDVVQGRQFDVTVGFKYGLYDYLTVIECKDYAGKVPVERIDAFVTKPRDVRANKAIMVSANGFQSGCIEVANRHGVKLLVVNESTDETVANLVKAVTPGLNVYAVRFVETGTGKEHELEDVGGRLAYLMNHAKLLLPTGETTPDRLIHEWQLTRPSIFTDKVNDVEVPLPPGAELHIPHEDSVRVSSLRFKCSMVEVAIPNQPSWTTTSGRGSPPRSSCAMQKATSNM